MKEPQVAIVGGGVSGLATAFYLSRAGIKPLLIEKSPQVGGLIRTEQADGCRLEAGPDSWISTKPAVRELAGELGLTNQIIGSNDTRRRVFIARSGELVPFPQGMSMMVPGQWGPALRSKLFSPETKRRFLTETLMRPRCRNRDVSVGELVADHFGAEVLESVTDPLLAGVYGGDAATLSASSVLPKFVDYEERYGSLIRGVRQERNSGSSSPLFLSLRDGMESLTDALARAIEGRAQVRQSEVTQVRRHGSGWSLRIGDVWLEAEHLILACPAHAAANLLENPAPELAGELAAIPFSSSILVTMLFDEDSFGSSLDGFGFLVPKRERRTIAAATWINTKFPTRVAPGTVAIRAFVVADEAVRLGAASDAELQQAVAEDLRHFMGAGVGWPRSARIYRWPRSMPQYVVGHGERRRRITERLLEMPTLHLVGNAYDGVGIPDCVKLAKATAAQIQLN